jgi:hypothetical protein
LLGFLGDGELRHQSVRLMVTEIGQELRFYFEPHTPETLPLGRLADYLAALAKVLGEHRAVHLVELQAGSIVLIARVDPDTLPRIYERATAIRRGDAPQDAMEGYRDLNRMFREDNGSGALLEPTGAEILGFPGRRENPLTFSGIEERGEVDGEVVRIGGMSDPVSLLLRTAEGTIGGCYAPKALAKQLARLLFEPVRLFGIGSWSRTSAGAWVLNRFHVERFEKLEAEPLSAEILRLRALDFGWGADAVDELLKLRHGERDTDGGV